MARMLRRHLKIVLPRKGSTTEMSNIIVKPGSDEIEASGPRLEVLDSVRGIAAMVVVIHHCFLTQPAFSNYFFSTWRTAPANFTQWLLFRTPARLVWDGYEAVTLFYVLSGLVLALPWVRGRPPTYSTYAIKRISRIYLPYLVAIAISAALSGLHLFRAPVAGLSDWVNTMNWSNGVTALSLFDHVAMVGHHNNLDGVIHSLIWEMRVSLIFPFLIAPIIRWQVRGAIGVTTLITVLIAAIQWIYLGTSAGLNMLWSTPELGAVGKFMLEVQWAAYYAYFFILGTMLALYLPQIHRAMAAIAGWQSLAVLIVGLLVFQGHWSRTYSVQQIMVGIGSALIIMAALGAGAFPRFLRHRVFIWIGQISYSLYLVHVPLLLASLLLLDGIVPPIYTLLATPFAAIGVAWIFDILIAKPSVTLGKRLAERARGTGPAATVLRSQFS